jgi:AmmeMemoRadiSam system protein B
MNKRLWRTLALSLILTVAITTGTYGCSNPKTSITEQGSAVVLNNGNKKLLLQNFDLNGFYRSLQVSVAKEYQQVNIYGGIVNHHLLADKLIAEFYVTVAASKPELVILVGANHSNVGIATVHTSIWDWETAFGDVKVNRELIRYLINEGQVGYNYDLLTNEHSIAAHIPYLKYYMPESELLPLILSSAVETSSVVTLAEKLYEQIKDKQVLIIASIDFSHYLSLEQADKKDLITKELILNRDSQQLSLLNDAYLDSPASAIFLFTLLGKFGSKQQAILNQSNSALIHPSEFNSTTSYMTVIYF